MSFILTFTFTLFLSTFAFGSHYFQCDLSAEVIKTTNLNRLDGTSARRGEKGDPVPKVRDHEQTITLEAVKILSSSGISGCGISAGDKVTLIVKKNQLDKYKKGDLLTLRYTNFGDSFGSKVTWTVK